MSTENKLAMNTVNLERDLSDINPIQNSDNDSLQNSLEKEDHDHDHDHDQEDYIFIQKYKQHSNKQQSLDVNSDKKNTNQNFLSRTISKISNKKKILNIVPILEKRGPLSRLTIIPEYYDPKQYNFKTKCLLLLLVALQGTVGPMSSSIIYPTIRSMMYEFHTSEIIINISVGVFMLSLGIFPLWWSSLSETKGRRFVYVVSGGMFTGFTIGVAMSKSIGMFIAFRILAAGAAAAVQAVGAGTVADLFETVQRGQAMSYFYLGPLCGPLLSPVISGALTIKWGWRAAHWFLVILGGVNWILTLFLLPETLPRSKQELLESFKTAADDENIKQQPHPQMNQLQSMTLETPRINKLHKVHISSNDVKIYFLNAWDFFTIPLIRLNYLKFPPVLFSVIYAAYVMMSLYFLNFATELVYSNPPYNFSALIVGLLFLPNSVGYFVGSFIGGKWSDRTIKKSITKNGKLIAEHRIGLHVFIASLIIPCAILYFGWTADKKLFWVVPVIGCFFFGFGSTIIFSNTLTYLVDALPGRGSTGVALNNLVRNIGAAVACFIFTPIVSNIGIGWLFTILFFLGIPMFCLLLLIRIHGRKWRESFDPNTLK